MSLVEIKRGIPAEMKDVGERTMRALEKVDDDDLVPDEPVTEIARDDLDSDMPEDDESEQMSSRSGV